MRVWVELSGENPALARGETQAVLAALGGRLIDEPEEFGLRSSLQGELSDPSQANLLAARLALAHRVVTPFGGQGLAAVTEALHAEGKRDPKPAAFGWLGDPPNDAAPLLRAAAEAYKLGGGTIRLEEPERRFALSGKTESTLGVAREIARVDRRQYASRRTSALPFQRPVTLEPRLARAAVNLARIRPGDRVGDPFLGTGALLLEAGLLETRLFGADRDATMLRGAVQNFAALGVTAEHLVVADAAAALDSLPWPELDAVVTDPPYGRASSTGGEPVAELLRRVLPRWAERIRPGGRLVLIGPPGPDPLPAPWRCEFRAQDRVHRSLTREFRVYARAADQ
jgi:putative methyltransferase (TIGR01177 family)